MTPAPVRDGAARRTRQRGISLVEAMVSLAAMGIGMLGLVGLQSTMRFNADIAKQRSEAVRIGQQQIELWRAYPTLASYRDDIVSFSSAASVPSATNTAYTLTATVTPAAAPPAVPPIKDVEIVVAWADRASNPQSLRLLTRVAAAQPAVGAVLALQAQGNPVRLPATRHASIPPGAVTQGSSGFSRFVPPGTADVGWVFNNTTGLITQTCTASFTGCVTGNRLLLSGFVRFDLASGTAPSATSARYPAGGRLPLRVQVDTTLPATASIDCFVGAAPADSWAYYCAMPLTTSLPFRWSGVTELLDGGGGPLPLATDASDARADRLRVCRYAPLGITAAHPPYTDVAVSLANQNYLVVAAGNGSTVWPCPADASTPPSLNVNTVPYRPGP